MRSRWGLVWQVVGLVAVSGCGETAPPLRTDGATCTVASTTASGGGCRIDLACSDGVRRAASCVGDDCICLTGDSVIARFSAMNFCALATAPQLAAVAERCVGAWTAVIGGAMIDAGQPDARTPDASDPGGDTAAEDAAGADTGADVTARTIVVVPGNTVTRASCATVCSSMGLTCAVSCRDRGFVGRQPNAVAAWAMYSSTSMGITSNDDRYFFRCDDVIDESCSRSFIPGRDFDCPPVPGTGTPFRIQRYNCCCER